MQAVIAIGVVVFLVWAIYQGGLKDGRARQEAADRIGTPCERCGHLVSLFHPNRKPDDTGECLESGFEGGSFCKECYERHVHDMYE